MILATKTHQPSEDPEAALLLDADLSILGAPEPAMTITPGDPPRIRPCREADYRSGRANVLAGFLQRHRIFLTSHGFDLLEAPARANLSRELATWPPDGEPASRTVALAVGLDFIG